MSAGELHLQPILEPCGCHTWICPVERKPHKCPLCDGDGTKRAYRCDLKAGTDRWEMVACHACDGKGIVWEPQ